MKVLMRFLGYLLCAMAGGFNGYMVTIIAYLLFGNSIMCYLMMIGGIVGSGIIGNKLMVAYTNRMSYLYLQ